MSVRLREPFYSVYKNIGNSFTLDDFTFLTRSKGSGYEHLSEHKVRKIVYRQLVRLKRQNVIDQTSVRKTMNPAFKKAHRVVVIKLEGCNVMPLMEDGQEEVTEVKEVAEVKEATEGNAEMSAAFERARSQLAELVSQQRKLAGEAEGYDLIASIIPNLEGFVAEKKYSNSCEQAKLEGMISAFDCAMNSLTKNSGQLRGGAYHPEA